MSQNPAIQHAALVSTLSTVIITIRVIPFNAWKSLIFKGLFKVFWSFCKFAKYILSNLWLLAFSTSYREVEDFESPSQQRWHWFKMIGEEDRLMWVWKARQNICKLAMQTNTNEQKQAESILLFPLNYYIISPLNTLFNSFVCSITLLIFLHRTTPQRYLFTAPHCKAILFTATAPRPSLEETADESPKFRRISWKMCLKLLLKLSVSSADQSISNISPWTHSGTINLSSNKASFKQNY